MYKDDKRIEITNLIKYITAFEKMADNRDDNTLIDYNLLDDTFYALCDIAISALDDDYGWLDWFIYQNDFGKSQLTAQGDRDESRRIKTLDDLFWLMDI